MRTIITVPVLALLAATAGCKTASSAADGVKSAGESVANAASAVPGLVNVDLSNVLNNLALDLKVDKSNIPINAQIPINVAANVCGVSINVLSIGAGGGSSQGCTANSTSPELDQAVQQQLAANGSVGGGAQTNGTAGTTATTGTATTTAPTTTTTAPTTTAPTQPPATTTTPPKL
jgi:predicted small secreted protein